MFVLEGVGFTAPVVKRAFKIGLQVTADAAAVLSYRFLGYTKSISNMDPEVPLVVDNGTGVCPTLATPPPSPRILIPHHSL